MGDVSLIPGLGRSPEEGKCYPLQHSDLENFMNCLVHGVAKSRTRVSDFHFYNLGACHAPGFVDIISFIHVLFGSDPQNVSPSS